MSSWAEAYESNFHYTYLNSIKNKMFLHVLKKHLIKFFKDKFPCAYFVIDKYTGILLHKVVINIIL